MYKYFNKHRYDVTCCYCVSIRTGVWTIAALGGILSLWIRLEAGIFLASDIHPEDLWVSLRAKGVTVRHANLENVLAMLKFISTMGLCFGFFYLAVSLFLVLGLMDNKPRNLRRWVQLNVGVLVLGGAVLGFLCILLTTSFGIQAAKTLFVVGGLVLVCQAYYIRVVHRYARIMEDAVVGHNPSNAVDNGNTA